MSTLPILLAVLATLSVAEAAAEPLPTRTPAAATWRSVLAPWGDEYEKLAPWPAIRWNAEQPEVEFDGRWHRLVAIDDVTAGDLVAFCRATWPQLVHKRFEEDLVEAMTRMGHAPGTTVALDLVELTGGKTLHVPAARMTHENRQAIWAAGNAREAISAAANARSKALPGTGRSAIPTTLSREEALADLDELAVRLRAEYAYWFRGARLFEAELAQAKQALPGTIGGADFACKVQELLSLFGDGHTQVLDLAEILPTDYLPFLVADADGKLVAFESDRSRLVDNDCPYVRSMDGIPIEQWLTAAGKLVARGSPAFVRRQAAGMLRFVPVVRKELGVRTASALKELEVELWDGKSRRTTKRLDLSERYPVYGDWPRTRTRTLDGGFGYLRIESMDNSDDFVAALHAALDSFADTPGLVIDVRGNGGGSRRVLLELFPRFMRADDPPRIVNVAAARVPRRTEDPAADDLLADRYLFPAGSKRFSPAEQALLQKFEKGFRPAWSLPEGEFSPWHYFLLRPELPAGRARYAGPVVVLLDGDCFSATDIFLGAFKGWRNVTLLGTTSGGGSGRARKLSLARSDLEFRASTMASFRPDGTPYDGYGIEPDVVVAPRPSDFVGTTDAALDAALALLRKGQGNGKR